MQKPARPYIPRPPKNHGLFGVRYAKNHMMMTNRWAASSLNAQYKCMVNLLGKNVDFLKCESKNERRRQRARLRRLKMECTDGRKMLKLAHHGDSQRIRNILQEHKDMQRLYVSMPSYLVVENINQRTFVKRKERDRLRSRRDQLTRKYEAKLIELSELQDIKKFEPEIVLPDEIAADKCKKDLTNSYTRLKAIRTITKAYEKIIQTLQQDAIYYEPILNSLQADIVEQTNFINEIINLGLPAMSRLKKLTEEYRRIEENTRKQMQQRLSYLIAFRKKVQEDANEIKSIVNRPEGDKMDLRRYNRETPSMHRLRKQLEDVEKTIKVVKNATLCSRAKFIYPVMKKQVENNDRLGKEVKRQEKESAKLEEMEDRAEAKKSLATYNMSQQDIERTKTIKDLRQSILDQRDEQKEIVKVIRDRGEIIVHLRFCVNNIIDTLRHIGKSIRGTFRVYPDPDLKLPLLKFDTRTMLACPPVFYEEDVEKLLATANDKVRELMSAYMEERSEKELEAAKKEFEKEYRKSLVKEGDLADKTSDRAPMIQLSDRDDPNVPNRKQIKTMSAKIVEEFSKKDD